MKDKWIHRTEEYFSNHHKLLAVTAWIINRIPSFRIENRANLDQARDWLRNKGPLIFYVAPHTRIYDGTIFAQRVVKRYFPSFGSNSLAMLLSDKFSKNFEELPDMGLASQAVDSYAQLVGVNMIPVVQRDLIEQNPQIAERASEFNEKSYQKVMDVLNQKGGKLIMFPEGHRETDNQGLLRADKGLHVFLGRPRNAAGDRNAAAVPVILEGVPKIQPRDKEGLDGLNPFIEVSATIGELITYGQALDISQRHRWRDRTHGRFTPADAMMLHLAQYGLPEKPTGVDPYGVYSPKYIERIE